MGTPTALLTKLEGAYWATYRFLQSIKYFPREVKWFIQRGYRGWADCDVWSFDSYIARVCTGGLKQLRDNASGTPLHVFPKDHWDSSSNKRDKEERERIDREARKAWRDQLDTMIDGFQAHLDAYDIPFMEDYDAYKVEVERHEKRRVNGMMLFVEHFSALWD